MMSIPVKIIKKQGRVKEEKRRVEPRPVYITSANQTNFLKKSGPSRGGEEEADLLGPEDYCLLILIYITLSGGKCSVRQKWLKEFKTILKISCNDGKYKGYF